MSKTQVKAVTYEVIEPPVIGDGDDPRQVAYVPVSAIHVDQNVQRGTSETRLDTMGAVNWALMEMPTITVRDGGELVATEGQNRVLLVQRERPDAHIWVVFNPGENEAAVALGIAKSRKPHTPFDKWQLNLNRGEPLQAKAEQVLAKLGMRLYPGGTGNADAIAAVGSVERVMKMGGTGVEGAEFGATILEQTLSSLIASFPGEPARVDGHLISAVGRLIARNEHIRLQRLVQTLRLMTAVKWLNKGDDRLPSQSKPSAIGKAIMDVYNKQLAPSNEIRW